MNSWTDRLGHTNLRTFTDEDGNFWIEQNRAKASRWAKLAKKGHAVAWEMARAGGGYTGRVLIDGEIYSTSDATRKFLNE